MLDGHEMRNRFTKIVAAFFSDLNSDKLGCNLQDI